MKSRSILTGGETTSVMEPFPEELSVGTTVAFPELASHVSVVGKLITIHREVADGRVGS